MNKKKKKEQKGKKEMIHLKLILIKKSWAESIKLEEKILNLDWIYFEVIL